MFQKICLLQAIYETCAQNKSSVWLSCCENFFSQNWATISGSGGLLNPTPPIHVITKTCLVVFISVKNVNKKSRQVRSARFLKFPSYER